MPSRSDILKDLAQRIEAIEADWRPSSRSGGAVGIPALETLFPRRCLPAAGLVELLAATEGAGVWTLALLLARSACGTRKVLVVVDTQESFYPPAAARLGIDLERVIVLRSAAGQAASLPRRSRSGKLAACPTRRELYAALDQALRCPAVGAVVSWFDHLSTLEVRRLQLAAEQGGGVGFLLRPGAALGTPSFAAVRLVVTPVASTELARRLRIDVARCQGGKAGHSLTVEIDDEAPDDANPVRALPGLASPAAGA